MQPKAIAAVPFLAAALWAQIPTPGFDPSSLDKSISPCSNFYQYACATWMAKNPIPADQARWSRFNELRERNNTILRNVLEKAAADDPRRSAVEQKIGDYYNSCMDEKSIDAKGTDPIKPDLDRIAALKDKQDIADEMIRLHRAGIGALFRFGSTQDYKDATQVIAEADQGGLGLPDRDYYLRTDPKSVELRKQYQGHVQKMFELLGHAPATAAAEAKAVMDIETGLARGSLDRVARRDPVNRYHKMGASELAALTPAFSWPRYLQGIGAPPVQALNVSAPAFFAQMQKLLETAPLDDWKTYLTWQVVHANAQVLPERFVDANFDFFGRTLTGAKEIRPRWKRCVEFTDADLGEALGRKYVEVAFGEASKTRMVEMVRGLEQALGEDIQKLDWMTPPTKKEAMVKLRAIANKIGFPDKWRDYGRLQIVRGDALGNSLRANQFEFERQLSKIGQPVDRKEWFMSPPTVNAYYFSQMNDINFPAGILQPPFFDPKLDDAMNYGGIGAVIGHELTHGFDDQGRKFDAKGDLRDWWTAADGKAFDQRAQCFVDEYGSFTAVDDVKLNGKLTLGENTADNGGLRIALMALEDTLAGKSTPEADGFTPQQRLFLGWARVWCENKTPQVARMLAAVDPHSPGEYRVNGVVSNMPEFQKAFACATGQPMVKPRACRVW